MSDQSLLSLLFAQLDEPVIVAPGIVWSDDCLSCLCNLPHSVEKHNQAVEQAQAELQEQLWLLKHENARYLDGEEDKVSL